MKFVKEFPWGISLVIIAIFFYVVVSVIQLITASLLTGETRDGILTNQQHMAGTIFGSMVTFAGYLINTLVKKEEEQVSMMSDKDEEQDQKLKELEDKLSSFESKINNPIKRGPIQRN